MGEHHIPAIVAYLYDEVAEMPEYSPRWLFMNFIEELTDGWLAYDAVSGPPVSDLDAVLNHYFWVFGILKDVEANKPQGFFRSFATVIDPVPPETHAWIRQQVSRLSISADRAEAAADAIAEAGRSTVAAVSFGHDGSGWNDVVLYWNPVFSRDAALSFLTETAVHEGA